MKMSVLTRVSRGRAEGERPCEACGQTGQPLREVRVPYSNMGGYWRDLCPGCIAALKAAPPLPVMQNSADKARTDRAWEACLDRLARARDKRP